MRPKITIDLSSVNKGFEKMGKRGRNLRPVFASLKPMMKADIRENFRRQEGPEGRWPKLSRGTMGRNVRSLNKARVGRAQRRANRTGVSQRVRLTRRSGRLLGKLRTAWGQQITRNSIRARSKVSWSGAHSNPAGTKVGHGATLPGRIHLYASREMILNTRDRIAVYVATGKVTRRRR